MTPLLDRYLTDTLGLDAEAIGPARVREAIEHALKQAGCGADELPEFMSRHEEARHRFYESLTVPETWFLRGRPALRCLTDFAVRRLADSGGRLLRILSIPCSTGEEPYSVLIMLDLVGFPLGRVEVHAADISERSLALARAGVYGNYSFRGVEPEVKTRYFTPRDGAFELNESLCRRVTFFHENAVSAEFLAGQEPYDVILCRNLLIYLLPDAREVVLKHLTRLLRVDGLLLAGHSEVGFYARRGWQKTEASHAFAFLHRCRAEEKEEAVPRLFPESLKKKKISSPRPSSRLASARPAKPPEAAPVAPQKKLAPESLSGAAALDEIRRLADAGKLDAAAEICARYRRDRPLEAEAFFLAGLLDAARCRDADAIRHFEKAVYLNPGHEESLYHLALLYEAAGNGRKAEGCRSRLQRKQAQTEDQ
ncbi:MAG: hypothetical protein PHG65_03240 [Kiritimatiellae bacterium]|nr:hypothetical protein [Kiritimatiellia bacterium]